MLASVCDKLRTGVKYGGEILHADPCHTPVTDGLGLMSIGVINGKKKYLSKNVTQALQHIAAS